MLLYELLDERMREHREHELAFDLGEGLKKMLEIFIVERAVIVSAVSPDIRWVNEMKSILAVISLNHMSAVFAFNGNMVKPATQLFRKLLLGIA